MKSLLDRKALVEIVDGVARHPDYRLPVAVNFRLAKGVATAICGGNGSGKSLFVAMLTGAHPLLGDALRYHFEGEYPHRALGNIVHVRFCDVYGGFQPAYYQQRWNCADEQVFPTVEEVLREALPDFDFHHFDSSIEWGSAPSSADQAGIPHLPQSSTLRSAQILHLLTLTGIWRHRQKAVNQLSSGELRKLQLVRQLSSLPQLLIIEDPYIGLDKDARVQLNDLLQALACQLTLVLVVSRPQDIPPFIEQVVPIVEGKVLPTCSLTDFLSAKQGTQLSEQLPMSCSSIDFRGAKQGTHLSEQQSTPSTLKAFQGTNAETATVPSLLTAPTPSRESIVSPAPVVVDFRHVTIRYGSNTLLSDLCWQVHEGEHWALTGENGAGKSTLLSLVCADNPQAYACDISLFGHRRGRGESIWDIKRRIGYVSPEIYSTYRAALPAIDIVASGLHDTIGLYRRPTDDDRRRSLEWMERFGVASLASRNYLTLSTGQQRLLLLIRAFVKEPDLLILDEPFHGLDAERLHSARRIIDDYLQQPRRTLIMVTHYPEEFPSCIDHHLHLVRPSQ